MSSSPLLLDTHVWFRANVTPDRIRPATRAAIAAAQTERAVFIALVSVWALAMLERDRRIELVGGVDHWTRQALAKHGVTLLNYTPAIAIESVYLPAPMHKDPSDRVLVATARIEKLTLVTSDKAIIKFAKTTGLPYLRA
jgi:PIN domain nuclease of toxin-antitoxin system